MIRLYAVLADCVLGLHLLFILWVIFGALFVRDRPQLRWLHITGLAWSILVTITSWPCPLTVLEEFLELQAGVEPYRGGFVVHYLDKLVYPDLSPVMITIAMVVICVFNLAVYTRALLAGFGKLR